MIVIKKIIKLNFSPSLETLQCSYIYHHLLPQKNSPFVPLNSLSQSNETYVKFITQQRFSSHLVAQLKWSLAVEHMFSWNASFCVSLIWLTTSWKDHKWAGGCKDILRFSACWLIMSIIMVNVRSLPKVFKLKFWIILSSKGIHAICSLGSN